ncbi:MAG: NAD-dependent epimerase [Bacteroidetes bacterium]|nr:MAG: NAD-dependent epimerase [Bacteroidota bacterium]
MSNILVIGANGQLGTELVTALRLKFGNENVLATDINEPEFRDGKFEILDVMQAEKLEEVVKKNQIDEIYHLAAFLSAKAEQYPQFAWDLNMQGLLNVLNIAKENTSIKVYWPSSIGVYGPSTPKQNTPQNTLMEPNTVYGISKLAGERWCEYYHEKYGVDVRSLRYPGLIGYKSLPGGGTTDYAVDIFYKAIQGEAYDCFLKKDTYLPMMYMEDAVNATMAIMNAPAENIKIRSSYNLASMSFSPEEVYNKIKEQYPDFAISYSPDFRQAIADSWPQSIDDSDARSDWGWQHKFDLDNLVEVMLVNLEQKLATT